MKTSLKLGDTVTALYGDSLVTGVIDAFDYSGYVYLKFSSPQDLGIRVENDGVAISPNRRDSIKLVKAGPALSCDDVGVMPDGVVGGQYIKAAR